MIEVEMTEGGLSPDRKPSFLENKGNERPIHTDQGRQEINFIEG